jgi:hypothetical protein
MELYRKCENGTEVFKLTCKKQKQLYAIKIGDPFIKEKLSWQNFKVCNTEGVVTNHHHHYTCLTCGAYFKTVAQDNDKFSSCTEFRDHFKSCKGEGEVKEEEAEPSNADFVAPYILSLFLSFIIASKISLVQAAEIELTKFVYACIEMGRKFLNLPLELIFPTYSRTTLSRKINITGEDRARMLLEKLCKRSVSVIWDAGKGLILYFFYSPIYFSSWRKKICGHFAVFNVQFN